MRRFSRHIPPTPIRKLSSLGWAFLAIGLTVLATVIWNYPMIAGLLALLIVASELFDSRRKKRFMESRAGEGICQFARSFDCRKTDTRIVRAVYEELAQALGVSKAVFPVRAADAIFSKQGLHFDSEELDLIAQAIAFRAGRSLVNVEQNPYFGRIETVADLVAFLMAQPEISLA